MHLKYGALSYWCAGLGYQDFTFFGLAPRRNLTALPTQVGDVLSPIVGSYANTSCFCFLLFSYHTSCIISTQIFFQKYFIAVWENSKTSIKISELLIGLETSRTMTGSLDKRVKLASGESLSGHKFTWQGLLLHLLLSQIIFSATKFADPKNPARFLAWCFFACSVWSLLPHELL